jgi:hypothetical protein
MHVHASKIYMVAQSGDGSASAKPITVKIYIDGTFYKDLTIQASQLYTLFDSSQYQDHVIKLVIPQSGLEAYTFTFG